MPSPSPSAPADIHRPTWEALRAGDTLGSRRLAMQTLRRAGQQDDGHAQAIAFLQLAQADLLDSSYEHAMSMARKAGDGLAAQGDGPRTVEALCLAAYCATVLGQDQSAWDLLGHSRQLALDLASREDAAQALARVENYSGIAASWAGQHTEARDHFTRSLESLLGADDIDHALHPLINLWKNEVLMLALGHTRSPLDVARPDHLEELHLLCGNLLSDHAATTFSASHVTVAQTMLAFLCHHLCLLQGRHGEALIHLHSCRQLIRPLHAGCWLHTMGWWAELQHALAEGEQRTARYCALSMMAAAGRTRHVRMRMLAQRLTHTLVPELH